MTKNVEGQVSMFDQDTPFGKMYPELSAATKEKTSDQFCKASQMLMGKPFLYLDLRKENGATQEPLWETLTALRGKSMMLNTGEFPSVERESTLSQILEVGGVRS